MKNAPFIWKEFSQQRLEKNFLPGELLGHVERDGSN